MQSSWLEAAVGELGKFCETDICWQHSPGFDHGAAWASSCTGLSSGTTIRTLCALAGGRLQRNVSRSGSFWWPCPYLAAAALPGARGNAQPLRPAGHEKPHTHFLLLPADACAAQAVCCHVHAIIAKSAWGQPDASSMQMRAWPVYSCTLQRDLLTTGMGRGAAGGGAGARNRPGGLRPFNTRDVLTPSIISTPSTLHTTSHLVVVLFSSFVPPLSACQHAPLQHYPPRLPALHQLQPTLPTRSSSCMLFVGGGAGGSVDAQRIHAQACETHSHAAARFRRCRIPFRLTLGV